LRTKGKEPGSEPESRDIGGDVRPVGVLGVICLYLAT